MEQAEAEKSKRISTHTPHAECDIDGSPAPDRSCTISTHTPHAECDGGSAQKTLAFIKFLLTHPMRSVTFVFSDCILALVFLLTHLMRSVTASSRSIQSVGLISTHTPHAECDIKQEEYDSYSEQFLLTHPMWSVTFIGNLVRIPKYISTHTPHAECDVGYSI